MPRKQGVLYTLSLTLFGLLILALAVLFFKHSESANVRQSQMSFAHKMYDQDASVQGVLGESFVHKSAINLSTTSTSAAITEYLPNSFAELDTLLNSLKPQIEKTFTNMNITMGSYQQRHALYFLPFNITYEHDSDKNIHISPSSNITAYTVTLIFNENITTCSSNTAAGGTIDFTFLAKGFGTNCSVSQVDESSASLHLTLSGKGVGLDIKSNGDFSMESNATVQSTINISFPATTNSRYFQIPIVVDIHNRAFNFSKSNSVNLKLPS